MKSLIKDVLISLGIAALIVLLLLFASFDSTFIYRGF
jgi:hypothetical protein